MAEIYERDIEDWICDNLPAVLRHDDAQMVGRQLRTSSGGILDVIAATPNGEGQSVLHVIEVKRGRVSSSALAQVLGYMGDLWVIRNEWWYEAHVLNGGPPEPIAGVETVAEVCGVLVGTDIDDDVVRALEAVPNVSFVGVTPEIRCRTFTTDASDRYDIENDKVTEAVRSALGPLHRRA